MTTTFIAIALVLLFVVAIFKRLLKFAIILAILGLAYYWFFVR